MLETFWDGTNYHSLDHRRLGALKTACNRGDIGMHITINARTDPEAERQFQRKHDTTTGGERMHIRGTDVAVDRQGFLWWQGVRRFQMQRGWRP